VFGWCTTIQTIDRQSALGGVSEEHIVRVVEETVEGKIEDKSLSVEQIRKSFLEHNGKWGIKLSHHTLNSIWEVAVNRATGYTQKKIALASHGQMENCDFCGEEHDISTIELRT
jgi:hypothetical protein